MQKVILLVLVALFAVCYARAASKHKLRVPCNKFCLARNLDDNDSDNKLEKCIRGCLRSKIGVDDTAATISKLEKVKAILAKDVQSKEAALPDAKIIEKKSDEAEEMSDTEAPAPGATLVTTDSVNARAGACTNAKIVTTVAPGTAVKYAGQAQTACGYTWYYVSGGFGNAWMASNFLREQGGGGGGGCKTRGYPLFKQCDGRWGSNGLGSSSTICKVGCLMSSVSMALNGLGKNINGQSPNPGTLNAWLKGHGGYTGNLFIWGSVSPLGLRYLGQFSDKGQIRNYICQNNVVILNVNGGGHWVLATGHDGGNTFFVNDPGYNRSTYSAGEVVLAGVFAA